MSKSERTIALRSQIQQARVQLSVLRPQPVHVGALRTAGGRVEYDPAQAAGDSRPMCGTRVGEVVDEVDEGITEHLADVATELGLDGAGAASAAAAGPRCPRRR